MSYKITVLPGDGIGPEITKEAVKLLDAVGETYGHNFEFQYADIGGVAVDKQGTPLPEQTVQHCESCDAILLGAVGGPKWDDETPDRKPETGLLGIRKQLNLFANLRPAIVYDSLLDASSLKRDVLDGADLLIVRELTGGLYFGKPRERREGEHGLEVIDTLHYTEAEIERIIRKAFDLARLRNKQLTSVDKANVLENSRLWREVANRVAADYPDVELSHMLVDNAAMQLVNDPKQFDTIVTENMFGDILSDIASMITGSLGMLPSASLSADGPGLYEPVHGSAPDIAGQNIANPLATLASCAMLLRYSLHLKEEADAVEEAILKTLREGYRTGDIAAIGEATVSTSEMGDIVCQQILSASIKQSQ